MKRVWAVVLLSGCLNDLPSDGDFSAAALACQGSTDYGACLGQKACAAKGQMLCGGECVDSDANHCGGCGNVCTGGVCAGGQCVSCRLSLAGQPLTPVNSSSAVLTCNHLPAGKRVTARIHGSLWAGSIGGACRNPQGGACGHWRLGVDVGEQLAIPGNACTAHYDAQMPADVTAQHLPVPANGVVRTWVELNEVTITAPGQETCHSNANLSDIVLTVEVEP